MQDTSIGVIHGATVDLTPTIDFLTTHAAFLGPYVRPVFVFLVTISIPVSLILFILIIIFVEKLISIRRMEEEIYDAKVDMGYSDDAPVKAGPNPEIAKKWDMATRNVESQNPSDWRQAIIEADTILADLLTHLGYQGEGIGEQLKRVNKGDFKTLDEAWEAHKVRNELAHAGSDYPFGQLDARRVIQLYRKVFEEFFYI